MALPTIEQESTFMRIKFSAMTWFAILFAVVVLLGIVTPPSPIALSSLQLSNTAYRLVLLSLVLPYGIIWFSAFYGYEKLQEYANALHYAAEGKAFKKIADGVRILAWGLVIGTMLALSLTIVDALDPSFHTAQTIISYYATLAFAVAGFVLIQSGTFRLIEIVHVRRAQRGVRTLVIVGALLGAFFQHLIVLNRQQHGNVAYLLDINVLLLTIVVPYTFTWVTGIMSAYELRLYSNHVKGVLYRNALNVLAAGLDVVIISSIAVQYVNAAFSPATSGSLGIILLFIYLFLAAQAAGYTLIAVGAKRLKKIEEV